METLSSTLLAAQRSRSSLPYVKAVLQDYDGAAPRLRFSRLYTGSETAGPVAAVIASDGSLVRARRDGSTVYVSRVTTPGPASTFSSWTSLGAISSTGSTVALARAGSSLYLFYVHTNNTGLRVVVSTDDGASWGSAVSIATAAGSVSYLAADANPFTGEVVLFYAVGAAVYTTRYTGSWSTPAQWDFSAAATSLTGLAVAWVFDYQVVVTGYADSTLEAMVWTAVYGDGTNITADDWSAGLVVFQRAPFGTQVSYHAPALDSIGEVIRLTYAEKYLGDSDYRRVMVSWQSLGAGDLTLDRWREPWPLSYTPTTDHGVAMAASFTQLWLVSPAGVWLATVGGIADFDASGRVVGALAEHGETTGAARVELDNADGALTSHVSMVRGMRLTLQPGYTTSAGNEVSGTARYYWVDQVELVTGARPRVVLHAVTGWGLLERWHARRQYAWAAGETSMFEAMRLVMSRVGLGSSSSAASVTIVTWEPRLTINPSESGLTVFRRLLGSVADVARFVGDLCDVFEPAVWQTAVYAYGDGDHDFTEARYRDTGPAENWVRVKGSAYFAEAFDLDDIEAVGERATAPIVDLNLTTENLTVDRAGIELRERGLRSRRDELVVFGVNCGQEVYDVIELTDAQAGLSAVERRVLGLRWCYDTGPRPRYDMELTLTVV